MPTYQYTCVDCAEPLEAVQAFTDDALTTCPNCGGTLRKVFSAVGVVFKGSGFYRTDSRSAAGKGSGGGSGSNGSAGSTTAAPAAGSDSNGSAPSKSSGDSTGSSGDSGSSGAKAAPSVPAASSSSTGSKSGS